MLVLDKTTTGDGLISALQVLAVMKQAGKPLSELAAAMTPLPQILKNIKVREKRNLEDLPNVKQAVSSVEEQLKDQGRVLVRYSGTENKARVMIEGPDQNLINSMAETISGEIEKILGI